MSLVGQEPPEGVRATVTVLATRPVTPPLDPPLTAEERLALRDLPGVLCDSSGAVELFWPPGRPDVGGLAGLFPDPQPFTPSRELETPHPTVLPRRRWGGYDVVREALERRRTLHTWLRNEYTESGRFKEGGLPALKARRDGLREAIVDITNQLSAGVFQEIRSLLMAWVDIIATEEASFGADSDGHWEDPYVVPATHTAAELWNEIIGGTDRKEVYRKGRYLACLEEHGPSYVARIQRAAIGPRLEERDLILKAMEPLAEQLAICEQFFLAALRREEVPDITEAIDHWMYGLGRPTRRERHMWAESWLVDRVHHWMNQGYSEAKARAEAASEYENEFGKLLKEAGIKPDISDRTIDRYVRRDKERRAEMTLGGSQGTS